MNQQDQNQKLVSHQPVVTDSLMGAKEKRSISAKKGVGTSQV